MRHIGPLIFFSILTFVNSKPQSPPPEDVKDQGNVIKGTYSIIDPNGNKRIVHYTTDGRNGFSAVVEDEAKNNETEPVPPPNDKKDDQKKDKQVPKIQFIPVPVYQPQAPQVSTRGNFYGTPYYPNSGYYSNPYRTPYGYPARYYY
ncbi:hypothetical protein TcasGA2_TC008295 [Tribolium castaneum]|uniref:Pupal cuticle protein Edg-84A-like Protein n=1 Tax=Tribolium castaneum TaxID=7070 RepID=D2A0Y6_TRICA|nr:PREDICTED: cuticle protein 19.8 isoform X1 [Tribolium castaneum]EFA02577.1 hypothetical protein TcasGA2_TC008295 [Tribolium castaneum]|eukprot:XP_008192602.1 PREDICTED: cuticle protein 19.8 isoform X1 [Tribolium castaneum]